MNTNHSFKLINGTFSASEATQVLFNLINSKIQFHSMENFSSRERLGKDAPHSIRRIQDLKEARDSLKKIIDLAEKKDLQLKIEGFVKITIEEE